MSLRFGVSFWLILFPTLAQVNTGTVRGLVTDPSAAVVPRAAIIVKSGEEFVRGASTDDGGQYRIDRLPLASVATYSTRVEKPGFEPFDSAGLTVTAGTVKRLDVKLEIRKETEKVEVSDSAAVDVSTAQSASKLVLRNSDLDAFADDSEDLANDLQMLAGPSAGPNGMVRRSSSMGLPMESCRPSSRFER